ncbi:tRNA (carboxymethyluridine(34)-5-O)-methyltransferase; AltName: Full=tRNA (uracil-5-)-methyltransferase TRM9; AltName: Full=tRNA [Um34] methyltransferase; AltName: Full=tRNA methylase 9 [Serendipita indica DSM 11827]|uniref:Related to TRM9-tRNA-methyltransferase modifies uridine residues at the wobble position n=1 Tax=Serendipita indica (strain DSM 11827) TaxID=1109443 RepID=G4TNZ1_SERID|nr:tRNA (carboxymethyluridine(34)-5-O)-methyltransferase; AltName: Full=tRNA (uracil-5-)-methyltransferase TRM9; AltName: Full=tRNA [Um34] methyltransferase; AltName: Full=tRNA methylase 9 [Serendipita indica DSM 11827]CCA73034.1 related to TRM9-tRNA-methyltransferase modifies uridine residues at the wobble position [Serendipita indica DSM 11827]
MSNEKAVVPAPDITGDASKYEETHVHAIYDEIASHFSATRYKPWPIVKQFMSSLTPGSIGVDLGCGNGKYMNNPSSIRTIGMDRSRNLLEVAKLARQDGCDVILGDVMEMPWRAHAFDYAISIATIHHLATHSRRVKSVELLLKSLKPHGGRALIYVWAIEQDGASKRVIPTTDVPQYQASGIDVLVPWVHNVKPEASTESSPPVYKRYYHMFAKGELRSLVVEAAHALQLHVGESGESNRSQRGLQIIQDGWERSNYYIEATTWEKE